MFINQAFFFVLFVCSIMSAAVLANPVQPAPPTGCQCSDISEITYKEARKMEATQDEKFANLLDSISVFVSTTLDNQFSTFQSKMEGLVQNYSDNQTIRQVASERLQDEQLASNMEELYSRLDAMGENYARELEYLKAGQLSLLNLTLHEMRTQFGQIMEENAELRSEISSLRMTQSRMLNILLRLEQQSPSNCGSPTLKPPVAPAPRNQAPPMANATGIMTSTVSPAIGDMLAITSADTVVGTYKHPVNSCKDLPEDYPSGEYHMLNNCNKTPVKVYCDMTRTAFNSTGGWTRVAMLDMTNSSHECPGELKLITRDTEPQRLCGSASSGLTSAKFSTHSISYSKVCGRIRGYQRGRPYAFYQQGRGLESYYIDGVSLTYGNPGARKHIWTFAAGPDEIRASNTHCPCTRTDLKWGGTIPSFVGDNYFCDTANHFRSYAVSVEFYDDPLWDGDGCIKSTSTCCCLNNPPLFCTELPQPTSYDIELRISNEFSPSDSDTPIDIVELYIK